MTWEKLLFPSDKSMLECKEYFSFIFFYFSATLLIEKFKCALDTIHFISNWKRKHF